MERGGVLRILNRYSRNCMTMIDKVEQALDEIGRVGINNLEAMKGSGIHEKRELECLFAW